MTNKPDCPLPQPNNPAQPLTVLFRSGGACLDVIERPDCTLPQDHLDKLYRKARTSSLIRKRTRDRKSDTASLLQTFGVDGEPGLCGKEASVRRGWNSRNPNESYLNAFVSGSFDSLEDRSNPTWDRLAHEEAVAVCEGWRNFRGSSPTNLTTSPASSEPYCPNPVALDTTLGKMTKERINRIYEAYSANPENEVGNLEAALYAFAPEDKRLNQCKSLLYKKQTRFLPEEVVSGFAFELVRRIRLGHYKYHDGRLHHWIGKIWVWFYADFKTSFYEEQNLEVKVNEGLINADEPDEREPGKIYLEDVSWESELRNRKVNAESRRLPDKLLRLWPRLTDAEQGLLRALLKGASKKEASLTVMKSDRQGRRIWADICMKAGAA